MSISPRKFHTGFISLATWLDTGITTQVTETLKWLQMHIYFTQEDTETALEQSSKSFLFYRKCTDLEGSLWSNFLQNPQLIHRD